MATTRIQPYTDAERAALGSILMKNELMDEVYERVPPFCIHAIVSAFENPLIRQKKPIPPLFGDPRNQLIFSAMCHLYENQHTFNMTVLAALLHEKDLLVTAGGSGYIATLDDDVFAFGQFGEYVRIIVSHWRRRQLIETCEGLIVEAAKYTGAYELLHDRVEQRIFEIAETQRRREFAGVSQLVGPLTDKIKDHGNHNAPDAALYTGFADLDRLTMGLERQNMIIVAARPAMGKTALAMNIAVNVARKGVPVGFFSLEMSTEELTKRLLSSESGVPLAILRSGRPVSIYDQLKLQEAGDRLRRCNIEIDDSSSLTIMEIRSKSRRLKSKHPNLGLIVIDYMQLISPSSKKENRQQEVSEISRLTKQLAKEINVPVLVLSQLNRQVEQRKSTRGADPMPRLSDLRESGSLEQDADMVLFIQREVNYKEKGESNLPGAATLRIAKQRNGPVADIKMWFDGAITQFNSSV